MPAGDAWGDGGSVIREVPYASPPGYRPLLLDLYLPAWRPCPAVVWVHGGAFLMGSRRFCPNPRAGGAVSPACRPGIAVASIDYRLSGEAPFPAQLHDVKSAIRWLRVRGSEVGIDPDRLAVWGESAGGHLAAMATVTSGVEELEGDIGVGGAPSSVTAGIDWYGPTDFAAMDQDAPADSAMTHDAPDSPESLLIGHRFRNARTWLPAPTLHLRPAGDAAAAHPARDPGPAGPVGQSVRLVDVLRAAGADVTFLPEEGLDHVFDGATDEARILGAAIAFLRGHLLVDIQ